MSNTAKPVRYLDGAVILRPPGITPPGGGFFSHRLSYGNKAAAYAGPSAANWWTCEMPYVQAIDLDIVGITFDFTQTYWFQKTGSIWVPAYSFLNVFLVEDTMAQTFTFTDTSNARVETYVFNSLAASTNPGMFLSHTDWRGAVTTVTSVFGSLIEEMQRSFTVGGVTTIESLQYASGNVTYQKQVGGGSWTPIMQMAYSSYGYSDPNGSFGDLKSASTQLPDGLGGWNTVAVEYYRYWLVGSSTGFVHGLKMHFGPEACRLMFNAGIDPATASDAAVQPYADHYFEYDPGSRVVTKEVAAVCPSCPGGGTITDLFSYSANGSYPYDGFNIWKMKTTQTLPDLSQIVVYTNYAGLPMLMVNVDSTGANMWGRFISMAAMGSWCGRRSRRRWRCRRRLPRSRLTPTC